VRLHKVNHKVNHKDNDDKHYTLKDKDTDQDLSFKDKDLIHLKTEIKYQDIILVLLMLTHKKTS